MRSDFKDTYKHKGMRRNLISELREKGITDENVLKAFDNVPRHFFLELAFTEQAYSNVAFQIGAGQTISHPFTVAFQTQLLNIKKGDKVLEIGTGSGFQTSILCDMGAKVFSVERQRELYSNVGHILRYFHFTPRLSYGDGYKGLPSFAPFDGIIVTCGAPYVPDALLEQLKVGGKLVIPIGEGGIQRMKLITKVSEQEFETKDYGDFSFVPMLENKAR